MSTLSPRSAGGSVFNPNGACPPLRQGDRLTIEEFDRRYDAMPELKKAELIEGIVYMAPPVSNEHGSHHFDVIYWLGGYRVATPGVEGSDNGSLVLDPKNKPQPDVSLRIVNSGQTQIERGKYLTGAPELIAEVAASSASYDLHEKLEVYRRHAVREYLVWRTQERAIDWFVLREHRYHPLAVGTDGVYRSEVFPGLWLDAAALIHRDLVVVTQVLQQGIASSAHADFVAHLKDLAANSPPTPSI